MPAHATISGPANKPPCTRYDVDFFFPTRESVFAEQPTPGERAALLVCADCPTVSRLKCLLAELAFPITDQNGVVGGTTKIQRQTILRDRRQEQLAGLAR